MDYDKNVEKVVQHLQETGRFENTLLILTSDHGSNGKAHKRIPLIMRFPHQRYKGRVTRNIQTLDIVATILNYLGVEVPDWMDGDSLLSGESNTLRPIIISHLGDLGPNVHEWKQVANPKAPFYSLGEVSVVIGHKWYCLSLYDGVMVSRYVEGHTAPLEENELPSEAEVKDFIIDHLKNSGYDVSSLQKS